MATNFLIGFFSWGHGKGNGHPSPPHNLSYLTLASSLLLPSTLHKRKKRGEKKIKTTCTSEKGWLPPHSGVAPDWLPAKFAIGGPCPPPPFPPPPTVMGRDEDERRNWHPT